MSYRDPERQREFTRNWIKRRRQAWLAANGPCVMCKSSDNLEMDFVGSGKANHRVWSFSEARRSELLRDYRVLCHTCRVHRARVPGDRVTRPEVRSRSLPSLREIKDALLASDQNLKEEHKDFLSGVFLLAAAMRDDIGQDATKLAAFLGIPEEIAHKWKKNLVENGIWRRGKWGFSSELNTPGFEVEFWLHTLVAVGEVCCVQEEKPRPIREKKIATKPAAKTEAPLAPTAQSSPAPKPRIKWCVDCYVKDHLHTRASTEVDSDPLCGACAGRRAREEATVQL